MILTYTHVQPRSMTIIPRTRPHLFQYACNIFNCQYWEDNKLGYSARFIDMDNVITNVKEEPY